MTTEKKLSQPLTSPIMLRVTYLPEKYSGANKIWGRDVLWLAKEKVFVIWFRKAGQKVTSKMWQQWYMEQYSNETGKGYEFFSFHCLRKTAPTVHI